MEMSQRIPEELGLALKLNLHDVAGTVDARRYTQVFHEWPVDCEGTKENPLLDREPFIEVERIHGHYERQIGRKLGSRTF